MTQPRALVIPFGVPENARGLGIGLAALVHSFVQVGGASVAIAQLHSRKPDEREPSAVEAFINPISFRELTANSEPPDDATTVITGGFEPPGEGHGAIHLLVFDRKTLAHLAEHEAHLDDDLSAGASLVRALDACISEVGGDLGRLRALGELDWESLESVLHAERCALHDPLRGGPHDRLAALAHLGRAVGDAPTAEFPSMRLAALTIDIASKPASRSSLEAARRTLERAVVDAPNNVELEEALALIELRLGAPGDAERRINATLARAPTSARAYMILSESLRARGNLDAALAALDAGVSRVVRGDDLALQVERGVVMAERGQTVEAASHFWDVLTRAPLHVGAYVNLALLALKQGDAQTAHGLVDRALGAEDAHPEIRRRAIQLALSTEPEGIARAARIQKLARDHLAQVGDEPWVRLVLAQAMSQAGESESALHELVEIERTAAGSAVAAEAQRGRFAIESRDASVEVDAAVRAAHSAPPSELAEVKTRARRLAEEHNVWPAHFAVGTCAMRLGDLPLARAAFDRALKLAPGASPVHLDMVDLQLALGDTQLAVSHAEHVLALEGESAPVLSRLAVALRAARRHDDADAVLKRAFELDRNSAEAKAAATLFETDAPRDPAETARPSWLSSLFGNGESRSKDKRGKRSST